MVSFTDAEYLTCTALLLAFFLDRYPRSLRDLRSACVSSRACAARLRPTAASALLHMERGADLGDHQWRSFRSGLPFLIVGALLHVMANRALLPWSARSRRRQLCVSVVTSASVVVVIHGGAGAAWLALIVLVAYAVGAAGEASGAGVVATWALGALLLGIKEEWHASFSFGALLGARGAWLDGWRGVHRWHQTLGFVLLRVVSFNVDRHRAAQQPHASTIGKGGGLDGDEDRDSSAASAGTTEEASSGVAAAHRHYRELEETPHSLDHFSLLSCFAYCFYAPLWLAGPIIPANAWLAQQPHRAQQSLRQLRYAGRYGVELVLWFGLLETLLALAPVYALGASHVASRLPPRLLFVAGYTSLLALWLKFLVIWRVARLWALLDGVTTVENLPCCVSNHYSLRGFWRDWHCSFNRWLVRYIYVPLGGRKWQMLNVWVVFGFTALWHDVQPKLLAWAAGNGALFVVETAARRAWRHAAVCRLRSHHPETSRRVAGLFGTLNVAALIAINLAGYGGYGLAGVRRMVAAALSPAGDWLVGAIYGAVQLMFVLRSVRDGERPRRGSFMGGRHRSVRFAWATAAASLLVAVAMGRGAA